MTGPTRAEIARLRRPSNQPRAGRSAARPIHGRPSKTRNLGVLVVAVVMMLSVGSGVSTEAMALPARGDLEGSGAATPRSVVFVGSNWAGTVDVLDPRADFRRIGRIDVVPDLDRRMAEMVLDPVRLVYFLAIRMLIGEGNDQLVDDMYSTRDGRLLIASRPSLADVVGIDIATGRIVWRYEVAGERSDHMALSPDGRRVAVSASTGNVVHVLDVRTGREVGRFATGDSPHENTYSADGDRIYNASIGLVYTPLDQPALDTTKGERYFQVVDADTYKILKRIDMGKKLARAGYPNMSSAVRPMTLSPDERYAYLQVSFFHGFVEYDLRRDKVTRVVPLPNLVPDSPREQYLLDSAHHGIAMNGAGTKLCVAGTMDDYAAIVHRDTMRYRLLKRLGEKPYWATTSRDGRYCYVSWSGTDQISVLSYRTEREVVQVDVGDHPQRIREGFVPAGWKGAG